MKESEVVAELAAHPAVAPHPGLAEVGVAALVYAAGLLEQDDNLTRLGNPTGTARAALRARIEELLGPSQTALDAVQIDVDPLDAAPQPDAAP